MMEERIIMLKYFAILLTGFTFTTLAVSQTPVPMPPPSQWEAGKHYFVIEPSQPPNSNKVEVTEVFSYACPHCAEFQFMADKIRASLPVGAEWSYLPADFQPAWSVFARAYYTAQALGILEKSHQPLFNAIYVEKKIKPNPSSIEELSDFYTTFGVTAADFLATAKSFAIETKLKRGKALVKAFGVDGTPTIVINGKYRITGQSAGSYENMQAVVNYLVLKELSLAKPLNK